MWMDCLILNVFPAKVSSNVSNKYFVSRNFGYLYFDGVIIFQSIFYFYSLRFYQIICTFYFLRF